jgi:hypothetical protein
MCSVISMGPESDVAGGSRAARLPGPPEEGPPVGGPCALDGRQLTQLGTAGELPTQLFALLPVIGEVVIVMMPPLR